MKKVTCDGNEACARGSYLFTEIAGIYPITPSSPMPKLIDVLSGKGKENFFGNIPKVVEMQSEAGAIGMCHGALELGSFASTYTSSQGLLLMIPNMYKIAGEMFPFVMHVAARSLSTHALSIFGDHQDIYSVRSTGFCMLASSSVQDAYYMSLISHLSAIESSLPFIHFFDGFRTSHEINKIDILEEADIKKLINKKKVLEFRERALNNEKPVTRGTNQNPDVYFQITEARNKYYDESTHIVQKYMDSINKLSGSNYKPFNYYGNRMAKKVIVAMGSVCNTIKEFIDKYNEYGLIEVHLYRPFSAKLLLDVLPSSVKKIAVLDRTKEFGSREPLYLDIVNALKDKNIEIVGGRYGLSSKDTTPGMIKAVYDMLDNPKNNFTVGIDDDVTNLSLSYEDISVNNSKEILVYGYGSDGMVSASKSLINILGEEKYVQGYFEYDSKKSGGVTVSHLRVSNNKINSSYLVYNPDIIVISNDNYLKEFDMISRVKDNGVILINTSSKDDSILNSYKKVLKDKNVRVFFIDANKIAESHKLGRKISMIMEKAILALLHINKDDLLKDFINKKFGLKNKVIAKENVESLDDVKNELFEISLGDDEEVLNINFSDIYNSISHRMGNSLKVSDFKGFEDGSFKHNNSKLYNDNISPDWINSNCIECGFCSLVCPHGVIRPFILDKDEYEKAPSYIKERCKLALGLKDHYFIIGISSRNCTGCGVCINTCPGLRGSKALAFSSDSNDKVFDYLEKNISEKKLFNKDTVKGSQLIKPKFAFHGACAGCGETAYIKLLTQIVPNLVIANATGCSSIYGGDLSNLPYSIPWASSLFEDNAEFALGMLLGYEQNKDRVRNYMLSNKNSLFTKWLNNSNSYEVTKEVYDSIDYKKHSFLKDLKNYIVSKNIWAIGGDGWAYDIGFGGIDHVLSSNLNINILVLDTESYSNTGGQQSKASPEGAVLEFASMGKKTYKKDLAKIAMSYPNTYVAQINLGANMNQAIKAISEANNHVGPSIVIAYCPCISHGIKGGMCESVNIQKLATNSGYYPIFRYDNKLILDFKNPNFDLLDEFFNSQSRFTMLKNVNDDYKKIFDENKKNIIKRFEYFKSLDNQD